MSVRVEADGKPFGEWKSVSVTRSLGTAARSFSIGASDVLGDPWGITQDTIITIYLDDVLALTGTVEQDQVELSGGSHARQLDGRSLTGDLVDGSVLVTGNEMRDMDLRQAVDTAAKGYMSKIRIVGEPGEKFGPIRAHIGESVFHLADRLARQRGFTPTDDPNGDLVLFQQSFGGPVATLEEGVNIKAIRRTIKFDQRASEYIVKGQRPAADDRAFGLALSVEAKVSDPAIKRYRPRVIFLEEPGDKKAARNRADWEAARAAAEGLTVSVTMTGFTVPGGGDLYEPGMLVQVKSPSMALNRTMQIESVNSHFNGGSITELQLTVPESATPKPAKKASQTGSAPNEGFEVADIWTSAKPAESAE